MPSAILCTIDSELAKTATQNASSLGHVMESYEHPSSALMSLARQDFDYLIFDVTDENLDAPFSIGLFAEIAPNLIIIAVDSGDDEQRRELLLSGIRFLLSKENATDELRGIMDSAARRSANARRPLRKHSVAR